MKQPNPFTWRHVDECGPARQGADRQGVNATILPLQQAPDGYKKFDGGAAKKFVLNPHGMIPA